MTMEQDFEAKTDQFPVGMRVLAVDDDQTCLRILHSLLHRCQYHVTTTNQAQRALEMLRENKNKFDLVISDVDMPDMDGFKLLELVGLEMDLPVIMLSAHSDPKYVMKGVKHGACDYLLKPVRIEELKNIWQHVVRKGKLKNKNVSSNCGESVDMRASRKRKEQFEEEQEVDEEEDDDDEERANENDDPTAQKRPRIVWTPELHNKFLSAVDHVGVEKAVPKKILDLMNVEKLTRENVASHLQKFRLALKKITTEANQQANMASVDSHLMQMTSFNGLGNFHNHQHRPILAGSNHFYDRAATPRHYSSLGQLNSLGGMYQNISSHNHNDGRNILQGLPISPLEELHTNNNKAYPSFTSQQSSLMVAPNNLLVPSLTTGFAPPHSDMNRRLQNWSNNVLSNNTPQSNVISGPDAVEWNMFCDLASPVVNTNIDTNTISFCGNMGLGSSNVAAQTNFVDPLPMRQLPANNLSPITNSQLWSSDIPKEVVSMGQEKLENCLMASDAGSLDDIVNSMMTQEQNQSEFLEGDLGFGWISPLRTCI
ncbi:unnamed protein product [Cochlearia groenlandica]